MLTKIGQGIMTARRLLHDRSSKLYLVSYPRAGSHWVRMILETTSGRPSAVTHLIHQCTLVLGKVCIWPVHDIDFKIGAEIGPFVYAFRHPREVIKSNLIYYDTHEETDEDLAQICGILGHEYTRHLRYYHEKLLVEPRGVSIRYEDLQAEYLPTIRRLAFQAGRFSDQKYRISEYQDALQSLTKRKSKSKTGYNERVIRSVDDGLLNRIYGIIDKNPSGELDEAYEKIKDFTKNQQS